jgi:hypothetical protein
MGPHNLKVTVRSQPRAMVSNPPWRPALNKIRLVPNGSLGEALGMEAPINRATVPIKIDNSQPKSKKVCIHKST